MKSFADCKRGEVIKDPKNPTKKVQAGAHGEENVAESWDGMPTYPNATMFLIEMAKLAKYVVAINPTSLVIEMACSAPGSNATEQFVHNLKKYVRPFTYRPKNIELEAYYRSVAAWENHGFTFATKKGRKEPKDRYLSQRGSRDPVRDKEMSVETYLTSRYDFEFNHTKPIPLTTEQKKLLYIPMEKNIQNTESDSDVSDDEEKSGDGTEEGDEEEEDANEVSNDEDTESDSENGRQGSTQDEMSD
jgi:hypothetical protein